MGRANCCNICTPPPESCVLGACCHDLDGDNVDITCEENVTESYCLTKPNSVFNAHGICGEKIACDGYYVPKINRLGIHSYIAIKSDGSVVTWLTNSISYLVALDTNLMISSQNAQRIQPEPFGSNGAVKIYSNNINFCAVQKKDGSYVAWGANINSQTATAIESDLLNCRKIVSSFSHLCILKEDKTISMHYIGNTSPPSLPIIPTNLESLLVNVKDVFCPEITTENQHENKFCFQLENDDCYTIGIYDHLYDVNRNGVVSSQDLNEITNHINTAPYYNNIYDINTNGSVTASDQLALSNYISLYGVSSSATEDGQQRPIANVSGVFVGANNFHFIKNDGSFYSTLNPGPYQDELTNVKELAFTDKAVCALNHDGTVVAWGLTSYGGLIPSDLKQELNDLPSCYPRKLASTNSAFCVLVSDPGPPYSAECPSPWQENALFTWGDSLAGGSTQFVFTGDSTSDPFISNTGRYEGLKIQYVDPDHTVVGGADVFIYYDTSVQLMWGYPNNIYFNSDPYGPEKYLDNIPLIAGRTLVDVKFTNNAYSLLIQIPGEDGYRVVSIGNIVDGGYGTTNRYDLTKNTPLRRYNVTEVASNWNSFAAITTEGTIICWGHAEKDSLTHHVNQTFIDSELERIGHNVNLHQNLTTAGYEGCFSNSAQKDFCKTEEYKRPDCNVFTGECDYDLGNFYPFEKVDNCEECRSLTQYFQPIIKSNSLVLNDYAPENPACFAKAQEGYPAAVVQDFTFGHFYLQGVTESYCENSAFNGIGGVYTRTPEVGIEPSGSCCVGLICEEGFNEFAPNPFSDKCKDLKICYDEITEGQCYNQRFRLYRGDDRWNEFKMYYHFEKDKQCSQRTGEQGC